MNKNKIHYIMINDHSRKGTKSSMLYVYICVPQSKLRKPKAHQAGALISGFCGMKQLGVFLLPLDGIPVLRRLRPNILSGCPQSNVLVSIHTTGCREALRKLSVLSKRTTWMHRPGIELSTFRCQVGRTNH